MMATDTVAHWAFLAMLVLAGATWAVWRLWVRRDDRAHHLAAGIADERRLALMEPDQTPFEDDEPTDEIFAVDPPVDRAYLPQVPAGMVLYRGGAVHPECAQRWLRFDLAPVDGCAVWLTDDLKASAT